MSEPSSSLTHLFRQVVKTHFYTMRTLLQDQDVFPGQPSLLFTLSDRDGQSQKELAAHLNIKPATMTVMLSRMEKMDLLERRPDEFDQRVSRVYLTAKGKSTHDDVKRAMEKMESICYSNFSEEEKVLFRQLLLKIADNMRGDPLV